MNQNSGMLGDPGSYAPNFVVQNRASIVERLFKEGKITLNEVLILMERDTIVYATLPQQREESWKYNPPSISYTGTGGLPFPEIHDHPTPGQHSLSPLITKSLNEPKTKSNEVY